MYSLQESYRKCHLCKILHWNIFLGRWKRQFRIWKKMLQWISLSIDYLYCFLQNLMIPLSYFKLKKNVNTLPSENKLLFYCHLLMKEIQCFFRCYKVCIFSKHLANLFPRNDRECIILLNLGRFLQDPSRERIFLNQGKKYSGKFFVEISSLSNFIF